MTNLEATRGLCNAMVSTFFPDGAAIALALCNESVVPEADYVPKDVQVFRAALHLVMGFAETSRSENGVSTGSKSDDTIKNSIYHWCNLYGLDADEELASYSRVIEDGSNLW